MEDQSNLVRVSIFGQEYTVKAPADPDYIKDIADFVNLRMKEVQENLTTEQSSTRIAILAAMNITDELFTARLEKDNAVSDIEGRVSSLIELIDEALA